MFTDQSTDISLGAPCRALDAVRADKNHNFWIAGTCGSSSSSSAASQQQQPTQQLQQQQQQPMLQILQFHNDSNEIVITASYNVDAPVRKVSSCPYDMELVLVASEQRSSVQLYRLPSYGDGSNNDDADNPTMTPLTKSNYGHELEIVSTLTPEGGFGANIVDMAWRYDTSSSSDHYNMDTTNNSRNSISSTASNNTAAAAAVDDVVTIDTNGHLSLWDIHCQQQVLEWDTISDNPFHGGIPPPKVIWDPHTNGHTVAVTVPTKNHKYVNMVSIFDLRCAAKENHGSNSNSSSNEIPSSSQSSSRTTSAAIEIGGQYQHHYGIMDVDYNPNRPYMMGMACRDGTCKFYDIRNANYPTVTARGGHSHYCTTINYNPFHDQLVVSTGTDHISNLWRLSSCSSAPLLLSSNPTDAVDMMSNPTSALYDDDDYLNTGAATTSSSSPSSSSAATNVCVQRYEYSDSVDVAAWGAADAWIYMSISYNDGKAVLQHVPSPEKYKILL